MKDVEQFFLGDETNKEKIINFYNGDIDRDCLLLQRNMFLEILQQENKTLENITAVVNYFEKESHLKVLLPELFKFLKIFITIPVTSATAERAFSCLRRLKTYLRSTMGQQRLNSISLLHFHKNYVKDLDLEETIDDFISKNNQRQRTFLMKHK